MRNAAPMSFGARLALTLRATEDAAWFFNVPLEPAADADAQQTEPVEPEARIQIGPLDV